MKMNVEILRDKFDEASMCERERRGYKKLHQSLCMQLLQAIVRYLAEFVCDL